MRERETETQAEISVWNYWLDDVEISTCEGNISRLADEPLKFFKYSFSPRCSDPFLPGIPRGRFHPENPPCKKFIVSLRREEKDIEGKGQKEGVNNGLIWCSNTAKHARKSLHSAEMPGKRKDVQRTWCFNKIIRYDNTNWFNKIIWHRVNHVEIYIYYNACYVPILWICIWIFFIDL